MFPQFKGREHRVNSETFFFTCSLSVKMEHFMCFINSTFRRPVFWIITNRRSFQPPDTKLSFLTKQHHSVLTQGEHTSVFLKLCFVCTPSTLPPPLPPSPLACCVVTVCRDACFMFLSKLSPISTPVTWRPLTEIWLLSFVMLRALEVIKV